MTRPLATVALLAFLAAAARSETGEAEASPARVVRATLEQAQSFSVVQGDRVVRTGSGAVEYALEYREIEVERSSRVVTAERRFSPGSFYASNGRRVDMSGKVVGVQYIGSATRVRLPPEASALKQLMETERPRNLENWKRAIRGLMLQQEVDEAVRPGIIHAVFGVRPEVVVRDTVAVTLFPDPAQDRLRVVATFHATTLPDIEDLVDVHLVEFSAEAVIELLQDGVRTRSVVSHSYVATVRDDPSMTVQMRTEVKQSDELRLLP
ncbi:MAG: hypothetical protein KF878_31555 [Planctomycetes bacterium]|nr:hypothetical protein [Planctomycetota bacterium]